ARERGINGRKISDHNSQKCEPHAGFRNRKKAGQRRGWSNVAVAERKERFAAVVEEKAKIDYLIVGRQVLTTAVLQQRKSKDETAGPEPEKGNHGKWAEVSQHGFAAGLRLDMTGYSCPRSP